jgi:hypothetical protein
VQDLAACSQSTPLSPIEAEAKPYFRLVAYPHCHRIAGELLLSTLVSAVPVTNSHEMGARGYLDFDRSKAGQPSDLRAVQFDDV